MRDVQSSLCEQYQNTYLRTQEISNTEIYIQRHWRRRNKTKTKTWPVDRLSHERGDTTARRSVLVIVRNTSWRHRRHNRHIYTHTDSKLLAAILQRVSTQHISLDYARLNQPRRRRTRRFLFVCWRWRAASFGYAREIRTPRTLEHFYSTCTMYIIVHVIAPDCIIAEHILQPSSARICSANVSCDFDRIMLSKHETTYYIWAQYSRCCMGADCSCNFLVNIRAFDLDFFEYETRS